MSLWLYLGGVLVFFYLVWLAFEIPFLLSLRREREQIERQMDSGPDCFCGHRRLVHTRSSLPALASFDALCAECHICDTTGYFGRTFTVAT